MDAQNLTEEEKFAFKLSAKHIFDFGHRFDVSSIMPPFNTFNGQILRVADVDFYYVAQDLVVPKGQKFVFDQPTNEDFISIKFINE